MSEIRDGFVPATCSDFPAGRLVPVSFCTESMRLLDAEDAWLHGDGPCPPHLAELERAAAQLRANDTRTGAGA